MPPSLFLGESGAALAAAERGGVVLTLRIAGFGELVAEERKGLTALLREWPGAGADLGCHALDSGLASWSADVLFRGLDPCLQHVVPRWPHRRDQTVKGWRPSGQTFHPYLLSQPFRT